MRDTEERASYIGVGAYKETFVVTGQTVTAQIDPRLVSYDRPEQVAHLLAEDLRWLIDHAALDLAVVLGLQQSLDEYLPQSEDLVEELCDDIERLLQHRLLTAVHLLLCDPTPDSATNSYSVLYQGAYFAALPRTKTPEPGRDALQRILSLAGDDTVAKLHVALVVQWDPRADQQKRAQLRRPQYNFDWYSEYDPPYDMTIVRFSSAVSRTGATLLPEG